MFAAARKFLSHVMPGIVKPLHALWNEVLGFLFLALGVLLVRPVYLAWKGLDGDPVNLIRLLLSGFFCLLLLGFGVQSFLKARRISRS
jgi:hypothetical protein